MNNERLRERTNSPGGGGGEEGDEDNSIADSLESDISEQLTSIMSSGVYDGICEVPGRSGSVKRSRELSPMLDEGSQNALSTYWKKFEERALRIHRELEKSDGYLVRDVFRFESDKEYEDFLRCVQGDVHYRRGLLQVCREESHVHVIHDCAYSNGSCRCSWYQKAKTYGVEHRRDKRGHRRDSCRSKGLADIRNFLIYYGSQGRETVYQKIAGRLERIPSPNCSLPEEGPTRLRSAEGYLEVQVPGTDNQLRFDGLDCTVDEPAERCSQPILRNAKKRRKVGYTEKLQISIVEMLEKIPICPPEAIVKHPEWRKIPDIRFQGLGEKIIKNSIISYKNELCSKSMAEYQEIYNRKDCMPVFSAGVGQFDDTYYNEECSVKIMEQLLEFQFDNDDEVIGEFVQTLYNILERKVPKLNTIMIVSPPSAGKNFFFDAIKDYYINVGQLGNANKFNAFPFQDAEGRRLVMWNEPNYSPEFTEPLKKLLGGDSTTVNVKYMHDVPVYRTPMIILSNTMVGFNYDQAFKDRVALYTWKAAPYLKDYDKKPNPMAIYSLFKAFGCFK
uniref:NS1 n=1 Tax=uncultured densovirus TaxID=748192 RepID=A0A7L7YTJ6_9VIRU|nr:NS1 [uncultured densovirus]